MSPAGLALLAFAVGCAGEPEAPTAAETPPPLAAETSSPALPEPEGPKQALKTPYPAPALSLIHI